MPIALTTLAMLAIVALVGCLMTGCGALLIFITKIIVGIVAYALLGKLFRLEAWKEMRDIIVGYLPKRKK